MGHDGGFIGLRIAIRLIRGTIYLGLKFRAQRSECFVCDYTMLQQVSLGLEDGIAIRDRLQLGFVTILTLVIR